MVPTRFSIARFDLTDGENAVMVLELQRRSYLREAELLGVFWLPPLVETVEDIKNSGETAYACFEDGELVGIVGYERIGCCITICRLAVRPESFRRGCGSALIEAVFAEEAGAARMVTTTAEENEPAVQFYTKRHGFHVVGRRLTKEGISLLHFEKSLC